MNEALPAARIAPPRQAYFDFLTALRGLAILAVVVFHLVHGFRVHTEQPHASLAWLLPAFNLGWFGVDVFFLISGYGLAAKLAGDQRLSGARGALSFARNRFWRIYPVYWLCCLFVVLLAWGASHFNQLDWRLEFPGDLRGILASALLIEPFTGTTPILPVVTWTLNCELGFYALVLLGILVRPWTKDTILVCAGLALAFAGLSGRMPVLGWLFSFWPQFACGLLVFVAVQQRRLRATGPGLAALAALLGLAAVACADAQWRIAAAAAIGLLLVAVQPADQSLRGLAPVRWLAWYGKISFPLFLLHVPIGSRILNLGRRVVRSDSAGFVLVIALAFLVSTVVAWAFYRWVETPLQALGRPQPAPTT